jgi:hypothetical protein
MTGPEHYQQAEQDIDRAANAGDYGSDQEKYFLARAQVHATLAAASVRAHVRGDAAMSDGLFGYQSEEVAEAFTEWCAAAGIEARDDQEYRWLRRMAPWG